MIYICPHCQYELSLDSEYYYCHNANCEIGYCFKPQAEEELSWGGSKYFVTCNLKKQSFRIYHAHTDLTDIMKHYFTQQELLFQGKSKEHALEVMKKIEKILELKIFW